MSDWHDVENNLAFPPRENITSNNLTENLVEGLFYYTSSGIERCHICTVNGIKEVVTPKGSVWQAVPSYDHFVELTEKVKKYDRIKVKGNYPDKISQLKSRIKHLLDLQANQDKEVERLRDENDDLKRKNSDLLALIAEGNTVINNLHQLFEEQEEELKTLKMLDMNLSPLITGSEIEIDQLRELLKDCQKVLSYYANSKLPCDCSSNIHYDNQTALNILTRINEVLK